MKFIRNALAAVGMIIGGALLLLIVLPIEIVRETRYRRKRRNGKNA